MDYAAQDYQKSYGGQATLGAVKAQPVEPPRTLASAASRIDSLNERLAKASEALSMVCSQIGAVSALGISGQTRGDNCPTPSGAVHRLNDSAEAAHNRISEIENLIGGITRALG